MLPEITPYPEAAKDARQAGQNFLWLASGYVINLIGAGVSLVYLARVLPPADFGQLAFVQAVVTYLLLVIGAPALQGIREVAVRPDAGVIRGVLLLCLALATVQAIPYAAASWFLVSDGGLRTLLIFGLLGVFSGSVSPAWAFLGLQRADLVAVALAVGALIFLGGIALFVHGGDDTPLVLLFQGVGMAAGSVFLLWLLRHFVKGHPRAGSSSLDLRLVRSGWALAVSSVLVHVLAQWDIVSLGLFAPPEIVGQYGAAARLLGPVVVLVSIAGAGLLPVVLQRGAAGRPTGQMVKIFWKAGAALTLPFCVGGMLLADSAVGLAFGPDYPASVFPFAVLSWTVFLSFARMLFGIVLLNARRDRAYFHTALAGATADVVLNLALIPAYGMVGAAFATVWSWAIGTLVAYFSARSLLPPGLWRWTARPVIASALMAAAVFPLRETPALALPIGVAVYFMGAVLTRALDTELWQLLRMTLGRPRVPG